MSSRRYYLSSEFDSEMSRSTIDLTYVSSKSGTLSKGSGTLSKGTTPKSLKEKKRRSHSFSRKSLANLFHTLSHGSGLDKSHEDPEQFVSLESYRPLDCTDRIRSNDEIDMANNNEPSLKTVIKSQAQSDQADQPTSNPQSSNPIEELLTSLSSQARPGTSGTIGSLQRYASETLVSVTEESSSVNIQVLKRPIFAAMSPMAAQSGGSAGAAAKTSKKSISRSRAALNWPFKKLLKSESSTDSGMSITMSPQSSPTSVPLPGRLFGLPLEVLCHGGELPRPVTGMLRQLFLKGPYTVGIFRKSANARLTRELRAKLDEDLDYNLEDCSVIVVGAVFKDFLRSLPGSLLDQRLYDKWVRASQLNNIRDTHDQVRNLLDQLPPLNRLLLCHFLCVLAAIARRSDENKMCSDNLGVCVGPSLLNPPNGPAMSEVSKSAPKLIAYLIDHCAELFGPQILHLYGSSIEEPNQSALTTVFTTRPRLDSSAEESDSLNSLPENQSSDVSNHHEDSENSTRSSEQHHRRLMSIVGTVRRGDDSSIDSLEREDSDESNGSSKRFQRRTRTSNRRSSGPFNKITGGQSTFSRAAKMSLSNLSRDSGLTLSDTHLYNHDDDQLRSSSPASSNSPTGPRQTSRQAPATTSTPLANYVHTQPRRQPLNQSLIGNVNENRKSFGGFEHHDYNGKKSLTPPSYQETMNRKEQLIRLHNKLSQSSRNLAEPGIYEQSVRVYHEDIASGANRTLRAVPVRVNGSQINAASPSVITRCAKDSTETWRHNINWSVAHLRSLFNEPTSLPPNCHGNISIKTPLTQRRHNTQSVLVRPDNVNRIDGRTYKSLCRSSVDLSVTSGHLNNNNPITKNSYNNCVTVIQVGNPINQSNALKIHWCDSLSGEESYV